MIIVFVCFKGIDHFAGLELNELGDFLAGAAAPLALLWFVIGYLLQTKELGLQRDELQLQRNEIKRQADLKEQELLQDHKARIIAAEPAFLCRLRQTTSKEIDFYFINLAARVSNLRAHIVSVEGEGLNPSDYQIDIGPTDQFGEKMDGNITFKGDFSKVFPDSFLFMIEYQDQRGNHYSQTGQHKKGDRKIVFQPRLPINY